MSLNDLTEFESLFERNYRTTVRVALFYIHDPAVAEDIAQEIFTKLWEKPEILKGIDNLSGYLKHAVKNRCLNYLEHLQVIDKYEREYLKQMDEEDSPTEEYIQLVQQLLEQLPPKRRQILELSVVESKSYQEIAAQLGISVNTVKDHIKKAYAFLREKANSDIPGYIFFFSLFSQK